MSMLVSCIMPSMRCASVVQRAIQSFAAQTYPQRELVLLRQELRDAHLAVNIRVSLVPCGLSIGELRNVAIRLSRGSVISHVDDDDWSHPDRLARSMAAIDDGADIVGSSRCIYVDLAANRRWLFDGSAFDPTYLVGGTLVYRRRLWELHPFDDVAMGEDTRFFARHRGAVITDLADETLYTATISPDATSPKDTSGPGWKEIE